MSKEVIESTIIRINTKHIVSQIGLFCSFTPDEDGSINDIDILVIFSETPSLLQLVTIENEIEESIGKPIDLLSEGYIKNPKLRQSIMNDLRIIYHA